MELLGALAQGGVVLLDEVPTDFILGEVFGVGVRCSLGRLGSCILLVIDTVGCHDCSTSGCRLWVEERT
jgi:hypothetical protein